jgi:hypothetical protein
MRARIAVFVLALAAQAGNPLPAAVGCTLSNPAQDLKYLFPEMTSYKEELRELRKLKDGREVYEGLKARLGRELDAVYETYETPFTLYSVFKGEEQIGIVHGVNVPGEGGVIQIFLSVDPKSGEIRRFFYQRLESSVSRALKKKEFLAQFAGLTLADFYKHDYYAVADPGNEKDKVGKIKSPLPDEQGRADYETSVRGVRKNLILLDVFLYDRRSEPFFERTQSELAKLRAGKKEQPKSAPSVPMTGTPEKAKESMP